jgi:hypothetical protein
MRSPREIISRMEIRGIRALFAFLHVVVEASKNQRKCILKTLSPVQLKYLTDLSYNLLFNSSIALDKKDKATLKKNLKTVKLLASKQVPAKEKKKLVEGHPELIKTLCVVGVAYVKRSLK